MPVIFEPADEAGVVRVHLSSPGKHNALSVAMWGELRRGFESLTAAPDAAPPNMPARVVLLSGEGQHFAAGGDIEEFPNFRFHASTLAHYHEAVVRPALLALRDCPLPVVAAIAGSCVGGGLEIAALCDLRIAGDGARFGVPIARLGFPLAAAEVGLMAEALGPSVLTELLLEARLWPAAEAAARGVVHRVVADDALAHEAEATAHRIAALSPQALRLNKRALRAWREGALDTHAQREPLYAYADSAEHREGIAAFQQKRTPRF